jgi:hypothetical protein
MKLNLLKYIIFFFFISCVLGIFIHKVYAGTPSAIDVYAIFSIQSILGLTNLLILILSKKNYHKLGNILFFLPQILVAITISTTGDYLKFCIFYCYTPFFIVQLYLQFKVKEIINL